MGCTRLPQGRCRCPRGKRPRWHWSSQLGTRSPRCSPQHTLPRARRPDRQRSQAGKGCKKRHRLRCTGLGRRTWGSSWWTPQRTRTQVRMGPSTCHCPGPPRRRTDPRDTGCTRKSQLGCTSPRHTQRRRGCWSARGTHISTDGSTHSSTHAYSGHRHPQSSVCKRHMPPPGTVRHGPRAGGANVARATVPGTARAGSVRGGAKPS
jgi:hypothetical protein